MTTPTHDPITAAKVDNAKLTARVIEAEAKYAALLAATQAAASMGDPTAALAESEHLASRQLQEAQDYISGLEGLVTELGEALTELVELHHMKVDNGGNATLEYAQRQPFAWDRAYQMADRYAKIRVRD